LNKMGLIIVNGTALSVGANSTSAEQIQTSTYQFLPFTGTLRVAARSSATGLNISFSAAGQTLCNDQPIPFTGVSGLLSVLDNEIASVAVASGSRAELKFRNSTAGVLTVDYLVVLDDDLEE
jgi:hypothetical protein